ncbi:MAG TPA: enolase C-terminal domain-like protein [Planctomycetaceae bacterium]|nr:enolase C-terminal domain-like protein [Planctomycetaceae bacterium]
MLHRRDALTRMAQFGVGALALPRFLRAQEKAEKAHAGLAVTDIEVHEISVPYEDWIAYELNHYYGPTRRTIYVVRTNQGLIGLGEGHAREPDSVLQKYVGTSPFDWVGDETSLGLGIAMYDLMGQAAGVPVYKLFGPKYRSWVPAAAWTVSTHPPRMANAVMKFAARGFTWMKYHLSPFENVIDQMEAMQAVAPKGFKIHHDVTMGGTDDHVFELLEKISRFPIAGCFEDPLPEKDIEGYAELRRKCRLPIVYHHSPLGAGFETQRRAADAYILGHSRIGDAVRHAGLFALLEIPFSLQNVGGTITRAMTVHMQAAFKTGFWHFNSDTETWQADVVKERLEPINGLIRVSERPGLGLTLDRDELERLKALKLPEQPKWILRSRFANGTAMYNIADPKDSLFMVRPDFRRQITLSYDAPITTDYWDPDGSPAFREMFQRIEKEGTVLERP